MRAIAILALLAATAAWAQMPKVYRIGVLETTSEAANRANLAAFRKGLREAGYVEGQNYVIDYRSAEGRADRFPQLAAELVKAKPDVIVTRGFAAARAANGAGPVPVVMASSADAVAAGVVKNLAHPGGNVTGLTTPIAEVAGRRIEVLKELAPQTRRIGVLLNLSSAPTLAERRQIESTAKASGMEVRVFDVRDANALQRALDEAAGQRVDALVVNSEGVLIANRDTILDFARRHRLPVMYAAREYVEAGGLIAYGVSYPNLYYRAASYVDRILKGARPGDLPIEKPTKTSLVINVSAATALGIPIPSKLLLRADELIR
ncbi:MAG TPA: ABC transporter substrate-binding protein [Burkholderiales bacterium]|nr:ABC transporter substrate-binding protein [Burkholderiales bacterium]